MAVILILVVFLPILLSVPAWIYLKNRDRFFIWEYGSTVYPLLAWLLLLFNNVGSQSLSNAFLEPILIGCFAVAMNYIRLLSTSMIKRKQFVLPLLFILVSIIFAVFLRTYMPLLPE